MRAAALDLADASRARETFGGGMQWLTVKGREYLTRYQRDPVTGAQKSTSLGPRSAATEATYGKFIESRNRLDERLTALKPEMAEQARMAKALRLNRAPEDVVAVLRAIGSSGMFDHITVVGDTAVLAYECEMAVLLPRQVLPEGGLDLLIAGADPTDAVADLVGVLRRARIATRQPRLAEDRMMIELRTEEGLPIKLSTIGTIENAASICEESPGCAEAVQWAIEQAPLTSIVIDRLGRPAPITVLDPRAWCVLRCLALDAGGMSVAGQAATSEVIAAVGQVVDDRWPHPFDEGCAVEYRRLHDVLRDDQSHESPRL
jgi:hypothetical protein